MATAREFSAEEQRKLLAELEVPFDPAMVKWKVVRRAHSGRRGAVLPFADPRAYTDRLNQALTPAGWGRTYTLSTLSNLTRRLWDGKLISTGKVLVTSTVSVHGLGSHVGNGEAWADREHAVTAAGPGVQARERLLWFGQVSAPVLLKPKLLLALFRF
jgi:hypothetical protein